MATDVDLPLPPLEMRELVGNINPDHYDNPTGRPIFGHLPESAWRSFLDFGCGCGRTARQLAQQTPSPERYVGIDLHAGMIEWCLRNLAPHLPEFEFQHHDVFNAGLNPNRSRPWAAPFPVEDSSVSIVAAWSVFTHLVEGQAEFYLDEIDRVLADDGILQATFFLFDKAGFPFLQDHQNALYVNHVDPTNAVVYDRAWLRAAMAERGLILVRAEAPAVRGFHWLLRFARVGAGSSEIDLPEDKAPFGRTPPPELRPGAERLGVNGKMEIMPFRTVERAELPGIDQLAAELDGAKQYVASLEAALQEKVQELETLRTRRFRSWSR